MIMFTLPTTIVAHVDGIQVAGSVAFGISVLSMIASAFSPIGLVLLPKASRMFASGASAEIARHIRQLVLVTVLVSLSIALLLTIFASPLIKLFLGSGFGHVANSVQVLVWGAMPFCLYYVLRGIVDAFHQNGINTRNLISAFLLFALGASLGWIAGKGVSVIYISFLSSLYFLGLLTLYETKKIIAAIRDGEAPGSTANSDEPSIVPCLEITRPFGAAK